MRKRTVKILKIIAIILVVLSLLYAIAVGISGANLRRAYADLKKDGRPMKQSDVIPPEVPDSENAALLYESAALLLKAQPAPEGNLLDYLGGLSRTLVKESLEPGKLAELQQLIEQDVVTQALSIVEQGTQRRLCRFDRDYTTGIYILLPDMSMLRNLSYILGAKACLEARSGNPDNAWKMVHTQLRLADAMLNEPIIVPQLVRFASLSLACNTIKELCKIAPPNSQQYRSIQGLLADADDIAPIILAIDGERLLLGEWAFNLPKNELYKVSSENGPPEDIPGIIYGLIILRIKFKPLFLADRAAYMRFMHNSVELLEEPYSLDQENIVEIEVAQKHHMMTKILAPAIFRVKDIYCRMTTEVRITLVGLALLQYKQSRDAFPDTLEALKLSDTIDPFSAEPLCYKPQGKGFIIYSIGPDEKDNGGSSREKKQEKDWDIVWSYAGEG